MKISIRKGLGFGLTSGIITTLGLMIGLAFGTSSKSIVLGGILLIAVADALSDAMGIHISEEAGSKQTTHKQIWESTLATVFFKSIFALSFAIPLLLFTLQTALIVSIVYGFTLLTIFSYNMAKLRKDKPFKVVLEHLSLASFVIIATYFIGKWISTLTI